MPNAGSVRVTMPFATVGLGSFSTVTTNLYGAPCSSVCAAADVWPETFGMMTCPAPPEMTTLMVLPAGTCCCACGSCVMIWPKPRVGSVRVSVTCSVSPSGVRMSVASLNVSPWMAGTFTGGFAGLYVMVMASPIFVGELAAGFCSYTVSSATPSFATGFEVTMKPFCCSSAAASVYFMLITLGTFMPSLPITLVTRKMAPAMRTSTAATAPKM